MQLYELELNGVKFYIRAENIEKAMEQTFKLMASMRDPRNAPSIQKAEKIAIIHID